MEKKVIANLEKCYAIAPLTYKGKPHILVAAEKKDCCILFDMQGNEKEKLQLGSGGVMTMVYVPGTDGQFLSTQKFYSPNDSKEAKIVIATPDGEDSWEIRTLVDLPFVHRFDILQSAGHNYLIACTLKSGHEYKEDWSSPGKIYVAELPDDLSGFDEDHQLELTVLKDNMLKNHGYCKIVEDGKVSSLVCSNDGIFRCWPPETADGEWTVEQLMDTPASDALLMDMDQDGERELVVLSPFHGEDITIYRKSGDGWETAYQYPEKAEFLHAVWAGSINGKPAAIIGYRKGARRLMAFVWDEDRQDFTFITLDDDCGPANAYEYMLDGKEYLIVTNREVDEVARYELTD